MCLSLFDCVGGLLLPSTLFNQIVNIESIPSSPKPEKRNLSSKSSKSYFLPSEKYSKSLSSLSLPLKTACEHDL